MHVSLDKSFLLCTEIVFVIFDFQCNLETDISLNNILFFYYNICFLLTGIVFGDHTPNRRCEKSKEKTGNRTTRSSQRGRHSTDEAFIQML